MSPSNHPYQVHQAIRKALFPIKETCGSLVVEGLAVNVYNEIESYLRDEYRARFRSTHEV